MSTLRFITAGVKHALIPCPKVIPFVLYAYVVGKHVIEKRRQEKPADSR